MINEIMAEINVSKLTIRTVCSKTSTVLLATQNMYSGAEGFTLSTLIASFSVGFSGLVVVNS